MWALGCVAVVLLTGGLAFCDPITNYYSESLAKECDLAYLQSSTEWQLLRTRPREFVENLLVLDENARMTADKGLNHSWFSNVAHKPDFENLYQRTIKHWHPKTPKDPVVEFFNDGSIQQLPCSQDYLEKINTKFVRRRGHRPMEEPYKPFPRTMHAALWPKRNANERVSDEARSAIDSKWPVVSESGLVLEERKNNVPSGLHSSRSRAGPTRGLKRGTASVEAQKEPILSSQALRSTRTMPTIPLRTRMNQGEKIRSAKSPSADADRDGALTENTFLMPSPLSANQHGRRPCRHFGGTSPLSPQQESASLQLRETSVSIFQEQSESNRSIGVTVEPHGTGVFLITRSESHRLLSAGELESSSMNAGKDKSRTLKRKGPKINLQTNVKRRRRRGSIYDILDDVDGGSDGTKVPNSA